MPFSRNNMFGTDNNCFYVLYCFLFAALSVHSPWTQIWAWSLPSVTSLCLLPVPVPAESWWFQTCWTPSKRGSIPQTKWQNNSVLWLRRLRWGSNLCSIRPSLQPQPMSDGLILLSCVYCQVQELTWQPRSPSIWVWPLYKVSLTGFLFYKK